MNEREDREYRAFAEASKDSNASCIDRLCPTAGLSAAARPVERDRSSRTCRWNCKSQFN